MKTNAEFIVNNEKQTVTYLQNYKGEVISGVAHYNPADNTGFDIEFGKALAFMKCEEKIRYYECMSTENTRDFLKLAKNEIFYYSGNNISLNSRYLDNTVQDITAYLNTLRTYYKNQQKMVRYVAFNYDKLKAELGDNFNYRNIKRAAYNHVVEKKYDL